MIEQSVEVITTVSSVLSASGIAVAPVVPQQVTALQARRALRAAGLYETVKMAVDAAADPDVQDSWQYCGCGIVMRWIEALGAQLNLPRTN